MKKHYCSVIVVFLECGVIWEWKHVAYEQTACARIRCSWHIGPNNLASFGKLYSSFNDEA